MACVRAEPDAPAACPACGFENRQGARFCGSCGTALAAAPCPSCGTQNPAGHAFCDSCGAALPAAEPASRGPGDAAPAPDGAAIGVPEHLSRKARETAAELAGERKQVTVLFADVTSSMDLAEQIDAERWRAIMDRFFRILADAVHRFEGTVDKFTGDGIMAIFGAPIAHEDHAQRACYAALEMQQGVGEYAAELRRSEGVSLTPRIGINSGEVVVGSIGEDLSLSYTALGHTVGLAQRMEALAEPGKAYATQHTAELAAGFLDLRDLGEFEIKGSSRPLRIFELAGVGSARGRLDVARGRGLSRFVGRGEEMSQLTEALDAAAAGEGRVVGIVADPGVGKSRLCVEFVETARASGVEVYEAHCQAHGRSLPLMPVLEMVRSYFRIDDRDSPREAREKVAGRLMLLDPGLADDLPLVYDFIGVADPDRPAPAMDAEARRRQLLGVVRRLIGAERREGPAITLVEDAHWIDPASEEFLATLVEGVPGTPTLVVVNFRPEYSAGWTERPWYRELRLEALADEAVAELLAELLGADPSLDGLGEMIRGRTGGNPFFIEELVRELAESGALEGEPGSYRLVRQVDDVTVPASVQSILAARIDRLGPGPKAVLGAAAVVGKDFSRELALRASGLGGDAVDEALGALVEAEFIAETSLYPEPEYAFRHPLTREVALRSQLADRRREIHRRVAEAIQELDPERLEEHAALVAQHYDEAGEPLEAAGWYLRAANWSRLNDQPATLAHLERVRELDPELPEDGGGDGLRAVSRVFLLGIGWRGGMADEKMTEIFEEGREAATRSGNDAALAGLYGTATIALTVTGRVAQAARLAPKAIASAEQSGDRATLALVRTAISYPLFLTGEFDRTLENARLLIELTRDDHLLGGGLGVESPYVWSLGFRALPLATKGRFAEARAAAEEGEEAARRLGLTETLGWIHSFRVGHEHWSGGRDPSIVGHGRAAVEIAEKIGSTFSLVEALVWYAEALRIAGDPEEALAVAGQALERIQASGAGRDGEPYAYWISANAHTDAGEPAKATAAAELGTSLARQRGIRAVEPGTLLAGARGHIRCGSKRDLEHAASLLGEARALCEKLDASGYRPEILALSAELAAARGDEQARREALEAGLAAAREMGADGWVERFAEAGEGARA